MQHLQQRLTARSGQAQVEGLFPAPAELVGNQRCITQGGIILEVVAHLIMEPVQIFKPGVRQTEPGRDAVAQRQVEEILLSFCRQGGGGQTDNGQNQGKNKAQTTLFHQSVLS